MIRITNNDKNNIVDVIKELLKTNDTIKNQEWDNEAIPHVITMSLWLLSIILDDIFKDNIKLTKSYIDLMEIMTEEIQFEDKIREKFNNLILGTELDP